MGAATYVARSFPAEAGGRYRGCFAAGWFRWLPGAAEDDEADVPAPPRIFELSTPNCDSFLYSMSQNKFDQTREGTPLVVGDAIVF